MPAKNVKAALDNLDVQVVQLVGDFVKRRKKHYEAVASQLHANLKEDTLRYADLLADKKINTADFELLLTGRAAQLRIELLAEVSVSKVKFEEIAIAILRLTFKTVLPLLL